ncbi:MAG TPA: guanylate kinase [Candidatus Blautia faecipullorum]|nr:guanylate kinase [Candidatus Blautia faecipullorum]
MSKGVLAVVSGFSGAGKGTVMKRLMESHDNYALSVSVTTREPREGEADGREYFFRTNEEVEEMIRRDQLLEHAKYVDHYYGTPRKYVEDMLAEGKDVILEIEIQGALQIKDKLPEAVLVFITPPSMEELKKRLIGRGSEEPEVIASRLSRASEEAEGIEKYDYILVNDRIDDCAETLHRIISSEHLRTQRNIEFINRIQEESHIFKKGE